MQWLPFNHQQGTINMDSQLESTTGGLHMILLQYPVLHHTTEGSRFSFRFNCGDRQLSTGKGKLIHPALRANWSWIRVPQNVPVLGLSTCGHPTKLRTTQNVWIMKAVPKFFWRIHVWWLDEHRQAPSKYQLRGPGVLLASFAMWLQKISLANQGETKRKEERPAAFPLFKGLPSKTWARTSGDQLERKVKANIINRSQLWTFLDLCAHGLQRFTLQPLVAKNGQLATVHGWVYTASGLVRDGATAPRLGTCPPSFFIFSFHAWWKDVFISYTENIT